MSVRTSVYYAFGSTYAIAALQLASTVITTRMMSAAEIGIYSISLAIILIGSSLADWGVNLFIVQQQDLSEEHLRSSAFVAWAGALIVGIAIVAGGHLLAAFYHQPELVVPLLILSLRIFLYPTSVVGSSMIAREMRYQPLSILRIANALVQSVASIALVYAGATYIGLAIGYVCGFAAQVACEAYFAPKLFLLRPSPKHARSIMRFGLVSTSVGVLGTFANNVPSLIIGHFLGVSDTGRYARAMNLVSLIKRGVDGVMSGVGIPAFSRAKAEGSDIKEAFLASTVLLTGVMWPFLAIVVVLAEPIIIVLLGRPWAEVAPIAQLLCVATMISAISVLSGSLLLGIGRTGVLLRREATAHAIIILFITVAAQFSLFAVAVAIIISSVLQLAVTYRLLMQEIHLSLAAVIRSNLRSLVVLVAAVAGTVAALILIANPSPVVRLLVGTTGGVSGWLIALTMVKHPLGQELARVRLTAVRLLASLMAGRS